jgi:hypothetical protein
MFFDAPCPQPIRPKAKGVERAEDVGTTPWEDQAPPRWGEARQQVVAFQGIKRGASASGRLHRSPRSSGRFRSSSSTIGPGRGMIVV